MRLPFRSVALWRGITARRPSADFFGGISDFGEWQAVMEIAGIWDPARPGPLGSLVALPRSRWVTGPGSIYIMAPFAFCSPGRFGDGSFGVLYGALDEATAVAELASSRARFMKAGRIPRETLDNLMLNLAAAGTLEDIRPLFALDDPIYRREDWTPGQAFGARTRASGADGVLYASVRRTGGACLAGFRPDLFSDCRPAGTLQFFWDGKNVLGPHGLLA